MCDEQDRENLQLLFLSFPELYFLRSGFYYLYCLFIKTVQPVHYQDELPHTVQILYYTCTNTLACSEETMSGSKVIVQLSLIQSLSLPVRSVAKKDL